MLHGHGRVSKDPAESLISIESPAYSHAVVSQLLPVSQPPQRVCAAPKLRGCLPSWRAQQAARGSAASDVQAGQRVTQALGALPAGRQRSQRCRGDTLQVSMLCFVQSVLRLLVVACGVHRLGEERWTGMLRRSVGSGWRQELRAAVIRIVVTQVEPHPYNIWVAAVTGRHKDWQGRGTAREMRGQVEQISSTEDTAGILRTSEGAQPTLKPLHHQQPLHRPQDMQAWVSSRQEGPWRNLRAERGRSCRQACSAT